MNLAITVTRIEKGMINKKIIESTRGLYHVSTRET